MKRAVSDRAGGEGSHHHAVQLYETDAFLVTAVRDFLVPALEQGDAAIAVATAAHRDQLAESLTQAGFDVAALRDRGLYTDLDAGELLNTFMLGGSPDRTLFQKNVGTLIAQASAGGRSVRVFGEMVARLWAEGDVAAALALEDLWNELAESHAFSLFCGYPMTAFEQEAATLAFTKVCEQHSHVRPSESFTGNTDNEELMRNVAVLQQRAQVGMFESQALREKQAELQQALARLEELDRLRNDFIAMVVHDIRSPNAIVIGFLEILRTNWRDFPDDQIDELLSKGVDSARQVARIVSDMLTVAKLEAREFTFDVQSVDLTQCIYRTVAAVTEATSRTIDVEVPGNLPRVTADEARQMQILNNLLTNAIKFSSPESAVSVTAVASGGEVVVGVRDEGIGIPTAEIPRLFRRFTRVDDPSHRDVKGTGLGLYISKGLVEGQGGRIWVDSEVGRGSEFNYTVPIDI